MLIFDDSGGAGEGIQPTGQTQQTIEGNIILIATNGDVALGLQNDNDYAEMKLKENGNLELNATTGDVIVNTPDGTNINAVANVDYINSIVGDIESILATI